jgi:glycosyltransferase involved in cell wall biosynthesis
MSEQTTHLGCQVTGDSPVRRPLRVCFVIDFLAPAGTEMQLLALIRHLDRRLVSPYLCLLRGHLGQSRSLEPADCPVWRFELGSLCRLNTLAQAWRFRRLLRRERIDVVQTYFADSSYFAIPTAWLAGVPHRIRTRNNLGHWLTPAHRLLGALLNAFTTQTIANCEAAREALLATEHPRVESVVVLENGVDLERFIQIVPSSPSVDRPRRVGMIANLRHVKGVDVLIDAAARLGNEHGELAFEVAGDGPDRQAFEQRIKAAGLGGRFFLPGLLADIPRFLAGIDVAVLSSRSEGMSNALLEYMAAARPTVATAVGAAPTLIEHGVHGLLVPADDSSRLAEAIANLLKNPTLARRLGMAARQRAHQRYSRAAMVRRFEDFYENLAVTPAGRMAVCPGQLALGR